MVGRQGKKIRIPAMTPQSMYRVYSRAIRELGYSPEEWGVSGYAILDDHVPFMERGVDTLNLIDDFQDGNWWHTSKDNIGILGEKSFQQTGEMTLHILRQLLPGPPSARPGSSDPPIIPVPPCPSTLPGCCGLSLQPPFPSSSTWSTGGGTVPSPGRPWNSFSVRPGKHVEQKNCCTI